MPNSFMEFGMMTIIMHKLTQSTRFVVLNAGTHITVNASITALCKRGKSRQQRRNKMKTPFLLGDKVEFTDLYLQDIGEQNTVGFIRQGIITAMIFYPESRYCVMTVKFTNGNIMKIVDTNLQHVK
jgi:hypothetical protein